MSSFAVLRAARDPFPATMPRRQAAKTVLLVLATYADHVGRGAYPSIATIASQAEMSARQCQYCLRSLEAFGLIREEVSASQHRPRTWRISVDPGVHTRAPLSAPGVHPGASRGAPGSIQGCTGVHPKVPEGTRKKDKGAGTSREALLAEVRTPDRNVRAELDDEVRLGMLRMDRPRLTARRIR